MLVWATKVATPHGFRTLKDLAENEKDRFLVYCYDFEKQDYTLGWAYNPRKTKKAKTVRVLLDDGSEVICTPDHRILMRDGKWKEAGQIFLGEELDALLPHSGKARSNKHQNEPVSQNLHSQQGLDSRETVR
jgi:hypothetical protein